MMLQQSNNIFFLGIKGVAMSNLAIILKKMGKNVTGCDLEEEFITDKLLKDNNIDWTIGFNPKKLPLKTDLIVYSAAHGGNNNLLVIEAIKNKIKTISQAKLLGEIMDEFKNKIAICGCHGKTTTSSLLVYALKKLRQKPSYLVGAPFFSSYQGGDFENGKYFVVEADEYGVNPPFDKTPKFNLLNPNYIIATNIDFDHPDVYKNIEETKKIFIKFFTNKKLIANIDDSNLLQCMSLARTSKAVTYGESKKANYQIINCKINENGSTFRINNVGDFKISLFGKHNVYNATAVIVQLLELGFKADKIKKALIGFTGAERRFEKIYYKNNIYLFDDYAHHPSEISATISAARSRFKKRRIIVIFQPHTYSRTSNLLKEFKQSLSLADISFVLPIFASARENSSQFKINSQDIVFGSTNLYYVESNAQLIKQLDSLLMSGDVVFTMGAGNVYKLKNELIKKINNKTQITNKFQISNLKILKNVDLTQYNTLRASAIAEYFLEAKTREDLIEGKKFALINKLPIFIIAGGSNLAITRKKINGLVIKNSYKKLKIFEETDQNVLISVSSGYPVSLLINETIDKGYKGFEYHRGLPGTVGGAIYMNSKWTKPVNYFGDNLEYAYLIDDHGKEKKVYKNYFQFSYDYSVLQKTKEIILEAVFRLKKTNKNILRQRSEFAFEYRKKTQPIGEKTSGCFFKNVNGKSAGQMIDQVGLKGFSLGNYVVSPTHANFIINRGNGKNTDLLKLIKIIKDKVKNKFGVKLEEEVIII